jgi:hypothetical protein
MSETVQWMTCAPRDYNGDERFFSRDTGLLCRGLKEAGVECRTILCGASRPDDEPDLIRATLSELEDPSWWIRQGTGAVVIHTWSRKEFTGVLRAIREARCLLVLLQDGTGISGPLGPWGDWVRESWYMRGRRGGWLTGLAWFVARMLHGHTLRLASFERERAGQFALADFVLAPSPAAVKAYRKLFMRYRLPEPESKVRLLPHPVAPWFRWDEGPPKENLIVAVGRWDDYWQKRPDLLGAALVKCLTEHSAWSAEIFGDSSALDDWHREIPFTLRSRVHLVGQVSNRRLAKAMARARILLCSSAYESFHIASAEALCSGCSVVGFESPMTPALRWFVSEQSGTLSARFDGAALADACAREISEWEAGSRDPAKISRRWRSRLHSVEVARTLLAMSGS